MSAPSARISTSSMTSPSTRTLGRSPTITSAQRSAAALNASRCVFVRPPMKRTSIVNGDVVSATALAAASSATAW